MAASKKASKRFRLSLGKKAETTGKLESAHDRTTSMFDEDLFVGNEAESASDERMSATGLEPSAFVPGSLNAAADLLNSSLDRAAEALRSMNLGVSAAVALESWEDPEFPALRGGTLLRFGKHDRKWGLWVEEWSVENGNICPLEPIAVTSASRHLRLAAAHSLPSLRAKLLDAYAEETEAVRSAAEFVAEFAASVENEVARR